MCIDFGEQRLVISYVKILVLCIATSMRILKKKKNISNFLFFILFIKDFFSYKRYYLSSERNRKLNSIFYFLHMQYQ